MTTSVPMPEREAPANENSEDFSRHFNDQHDKARNRMAWCLRFINNSRKSLVKKGGPLSCDEKEKAKIRLFSLAQKSEWPLSSTRGEKLQKQLKFLRPYIDKNGLVFMENRTQEKSLIILPYAHPITMAFANWVHLKLYHAGVQATLAEIRREIWIIHGPSCIKKALRSCRPCRRYKSKPFRPAEGKLSGFRMSPSPCFSKFGIDHTGPLYLDTGEKAWILLFVCTVTRALKLVLCYQPDAEYTAAAIRSLLANHVPPFSKVEIHSDNAKAFVKCQKMHFPLHNVDWNFIPARTPHYGGFYERFCRLVKDSLRPMFHGLKLGHLQLQTALDELAMAINMRPLCPVSSDPRDELPPSQTNMYKQVDGQVVSPPILTCLSMSWAVDS